MSGHVSVAVAVPVYRGGAYVLERFLANQKEVQQRYPSSELVFATAEGDFVPELEALIVSWGLRGRVLHYEVVKPGPARSRVWNIACGREALRRYMLEHTDADYMLCLDADMTYDPGVIGILEHQIQGWDAVFSGYYQRGFGIALAGGGCCMLTRAVLADIGFRCVEFPNGVVMNEDRLLEFDLIGSGKRVRKGFFLSICHYEDDQSYKHIAPRPMGLYRRVTHARPVRYGLTRASMATRYDIAAGLHGLMHRLLGALAWPLRAVPGLRGDRGGSYRERGRDPL